MPNICSNGYFEFWAINWHKGVKYVLQNTLFWGVFFWLTSLWLMAYQIIFNIGWVVDKHKFIRKINNRSTVSIICRGHITCRASKCAFQISLQFCGEIDINVKFLTFVFISGQFWKGHKWVRKSKIISEINLNMVYQDSIWK